ncbi:MAG: peptidase S41 [Verrucomicrobia bacterium]|nr:peptidase S41 [Verrucomicrobiota bacterium]
MKKVKIGLIGLLLSGSVWLSYGFADNYFEISKNLDIFSTLMRELNTYYVDETKPGELMKTAIDGMLTSLDPYTNYIPESKIEDYKFMTTGQYGGIGALIHKDSNLIVISEPYENFPAYKAGLKAGDILIEIDDKKVDGKSTSEISEFLKGQPGTEVDLKVKNPIDASTRKVTVVREKIKIDDVPYYGMLDDEIGYIKLISFTQTSSQSFIEALKALRKDSLKSLIFDLRGNGGGLLMEAVHIVNTVIPQGQIVVETKGKLKEWDATYRTVNEPIDTKIPVVILVDENSASASEIVAGTLQDYDRAVIMGRETFGKGLVQQTRPLSYNAQLKVTVAKYYIPSGRCIQKLDYSHKDLSGKAKEIPDSLIGVFKTLNNKRKVYDGKGIKPDVNLERTKVSKLALTLMRKHLVFDYATLYASKNKSIEDAGKFKFNDEDYQDFISFLADKEYEYQTKSEQLLSKLKKTAEKEKYYEGIQSEYEALEAKIKHDKLSDLNKFKDEIKTLIESEIVSRFYFQKGRIKQSLTNDSEIVEAKNLLHQMKRYDGILAGNYSEEEHN